MGSLGDKDNVQEYLYIRVDSVMGEVFFKEFMDRSYESDMVDRESDEDFEIGDYISGYLSGGIGIIISDSWFVGEEEEQVFYQVWLIVWCVVGVSDRGVVKKIGWRYLVDFVLKEENDLK